MPRWLIFARALLPIHYRDPARPGGEGRVSLKDIATWPPEKITRAEWRVVGNTLKKAQQELEKDGCRRSWFDASISICLERGKEPSDGGS